MTAPSSTRSIVRKSLNVVVVASTLVAATMAATSGAEAKPFWPHHHFWGPGLGLGIGLLGAAAAYEATSSDCHWISRYDAYGNYVGSVRVCG